MAFNIYEWRRNQLLTENHNSDGMGDYNKEMLQQLLNWYKTQDDADQAMINKLEMQIGGINEVKVSNVEFVAGDLYPANVHLGSSEKFQTKEKFEAWREKFKKMYGDIELKKGPAGWKPVK
jgi:hypothetical protein